MNLIDQLGGYEKANSKLLKMDKILKEVYYSPSDAQKANELRQALLEYRRQHNIFEVGDKVVFEAHFCDEHKGSGCGEITYCTKDKRVFEIDNYYLVSLDEIRHATDEEIKAGKRLEVKSEN
ncbi:hypothetical protein VH96_01425 [Acinetobacter indicus]|uniref:hypothetical protein n=1 Tax=Acinetobacter indicus TaxID=756892 RepID=UPI0005F7FE46|nr:hypothetical protein [Acinetobacter indicus]KJV46102.1 hypothetical protein VH96_01425 [Acinetobacter indicus]